MAASSEGAIAKAFGLDAATRKQQFNLRSAQAMEKGVGTSDLKG